MSVRNVISVCVGCLFIVPHVGIAQERLARAEVVEDVRVFMGALEGTHPDPYAAVGGKLEFKRLVGELIASVPAEGLDAVGVYNLLRPFVADLGDSHTGLTRPASGDPTTTGRLPLRFAIATDAMFVSEASRGLEDLIGHRLVAVEDVPVARLADLAAGIFPAENRFGRLRAVSRAVRSVAYSPELVGRRLDALRIRFEAPDGTETVRVIPYVDPGVLSQAWWSPGPAAGPDPGQGPIWWRHLEPEGVGYLRLESIEGAEAFREARDRRDLPDYVSRYYQRYLGRDAPVDLDQALDGIPCFTNTVTELLEAMRANRSTHLIVDVRGNGGGWSSLMEPLFLFLFGEAYLDYPFPDVWVDVASRRLMEMNGWTDEDLAAAWGPDVSPGDYRFQVAGPPRGTLGLAEYADRLRKFGCGLAETFESLAGAPLHMPTVVVLIDPDTFSAAYHVAYRLWRLGASLVGVPSAQAGNAFTNVIRIELPNSGLTGSIARSMQIFFPEDDDLGRALTPQFPMSWSDYARHDFSPDSELRHALELISKGRIP
jgi:hypothetical protein